ncbi:hypothetical protein ACFYO2_47730 [Streptomyces sp. NPDC006602]|uniref:hypothetical protein n=1 Tax=Streptomyces sp. NPDC006602 TaxID=3364751 RepID=UPI003694DF7B
MFQQIGSVIGVSVLVAVLGVASGGATLEVFRHGWWAAAGISGLGIIACLGLTPRKKAAADPSVPIGAPAWD